MRKMIFKIRCMLFFFTTSVQVGFLEEFGATLGANHALLQRVKRQSSPTKSVLMVTDYHVRCSVVSRYALTKVHSSVWNQLPVTKEAAFEVDLPSSAFISNFTITSNGKVYIAQVKERSVARKIYDAAKKQGKTAGLVATKEREYEKFRVAVSVPSGAHVSFSLSYEELLSRRLGRYELTLGLRPGQLVKNLSLSVSIAEKTDITFVKVLPLRTNRLLSNTVQGETEPPPSTQVEQNPYCANVHYSPNLQQQSTVSADGLNADFIILYDVDLSDLMGDVQVSDGYFVHFFAPRGLPVVPKDVIFVIDISGSMIGTKIKQTKQAMLTILGDLREGDHFNIITFSDKVHTWRKGHTVRATRNNVRDAKEYVKRIVAEGWTNINAALLSAAQLVNPPTSRSSAQISGGRRVPLVIFLTDGEATIGVTSGETILNNAKKALGSASLFGLAFGDDADFPLLRRLALENRGVARMVYEEADAALQLKGFYDEVASPLLSDIQLAYLEDQAFDVTRSIFPNFFRGSELVVTGKIKPDARDLKVELTAWDSKQKLKVDNDFIISKAEGNGTTLSKSCPGVINGLLNFVHRLWAYITIKELLLAKLNTTDPATLQLLTDKATNLSLKYNFVTPVTSLIVVKPDVDETTRPTTGFSSTPRPTPLSASRTSAPLTHSTVTVSKSASSNATAIKKPSSTSYPKTNKHKPDPHVTKPTPRNTPPGLHTTGHPVTLPVSGKNSPPSTTGKTVPPPSSKTSTTLAPGSIKRAPAGLFGKTSTIPPSSSKTTSASPGRSSTPMFTTFKTASTTHRVKTSTLLSHLVKQVHTTVNTSTIPSISIKTASAPHAGKSTNPMPSTVKTVAEIGTIPDTDISQVYLSTVPYGTLSLSLPTESPQGTDSETDLDIATMVPATFAPMPGFTDESKLWEAAGLLDVSTVIQIQHKDIDLVKDYDENIDYDYDFSFDTWEDTDTFDTPSRLSSRRVFSSSVDGDPHFVVQLSKLHQNLCFTIDGTANDVLRLLEDPENGIIVDGHLMWAPSKLGVEDRKRTYFDEFTISLTRGGIFGFLITVTLDSVMVEGEGKEILPINQPGSVKRQGLRVTMDKNQSCWIELKIGVSFLVLFHFYEHPSYQQMAHLGFYIADGHGLSPLTQGLLGQFQHADMDVVKVKDVHGASVHHDQHGKREFLTQAILSWGTVHISVTLQDKKVKDTSRKSHKGRCWVVPKGDVERLLGRPYESYVVDHV